MSPQERDGKRCAVYVRVWSEGDYRGPSRTLQVDTCMSRAEALGFHPSDVEIIEDFDSGTGTIRPGLDKIRTEVAQGTLSAVVVYHPETLAVGMGTQLRLMDDIESHGAKVHFAQEGFDSSPEGMSLYLTRKFLAEYLDEKRRTRRTRHAGTNREGQH